MANEVIARWTTILTNMALVVGLAKILLRAYADPQSLAPVERHRTRHWMVLNYQKFMRVHRAYQSGISLPIQRCRHGPADSKPKTCASSGTRLRAS